MFFCFVYHTLRCVESIDTVILFQYHMFKMIQYPHLIEFKVSNL